MASVVTAVRRGAARVERLFLEHGLRFVVSASAVSLGLALAIAAIALSLGFGEDLLDPFKGQPLWLLGLLAVLLAPVIENLALFACFELASAAAAKLAPRDSRRNAVRALAGALALGFAFLHRDQSPLFGAPILPIAIAVTACFVWGQRHRRRRRGLGLSMAIHALVNAVGVALYALW